VIVLTRALREICEKNFAGMEALANGDEKQSGESKDSPKPHVICFHKVSIAKAGTNVNSDGLLNKGQHDAAEHYEGSCDPQRGSERDVL
jgi:hypothetical protein